MLTTFNNAVAMEHVAVAIVISDPWVRSAPPNAPTLGVFMKISNHTEHTVKLLSVNADGYERIELHRTVAQNGMMKMLKQAFIPIPAHSELHLKPGSWHVMLIKPDRVPYKGEKVILTLEFDNGTTQVVNALVRKGEGMKNLHKH